MVLRRSVIAAGLGLALLPATVSAAPTFVLGSENSDALLGSDAEVRILARGGDDIAAATESAPVNVDVEFNDEILGGSGDDLLFGDVLCAAGVMVPHFCTLDDWRQPGDADRLAGGSGDDELYGAADIDWLDGGGGTDLLLGGVEGPRLPGRSVERLYGGDGDDQLYSNLRRAITNQLGVTETGAAEAVLDGGDGSDQLVGAHASRDRMSGGDGADELTARSNASTASCIVHSSDGAACVDRLHGGRGDDLLSGGNAPDLLRGGAHNDELDGGNGNDSLFGGDGDDVVDGGIGADRLSGGAGDDVLIGLERTIGAGVDTFLSCGSGHDTVYRRSGDGQAPADCELVVTQ